MHSRAILFTLAALAGAHAQSSSSRASSSLAAGSSSSGIGTPTNSAQLPSLSGVSSCVTNCLTIAASAAGCESEVAVNCFCAAPKNYTTTLLACLNGNGGGDVCPGEVNTAESLVEQFCAAASKPTSLSFASFTPSSARSSSAPSGSNSAASTSSATSPPSVSPSGSGAPNGSSSIAGLRLPLGAVLTAVAGILLGALVVL
ncbi:hypothetical protein C8R46DRAFT_1121160 [Mycena filopes]|nr:hypothetical protein C8R46DRAFT_1121160 [Mycena filopes]